MDYPKFLKESIDSAIDYIIHNDELYSNRPGLDFSRKRGLSKKNIIKFLIAMSGGSLAKELRECNMGVTPSSLVQSRTKIPPEVFKTVFERFNFYSNGIDRQGAFGYRILAADGSALNMFRNPTSPSFVKNSGTPEGFCQMHVTALYDVCNNTYVQATVQPEPQKDEIGALVEIIKGTQFCENTLLLMDRGFSSYNLFKHISGKENLDFLCRVKNSKTAMRAVASLPMAPLDVNVVFTVATTQTKEDKDRNHVFIQTHANSEKEYSQKTRAGRWDFESPCTMSFRILRFYISPNELETVATSLPPCFTSNNIRDLYHMRWGIETSFRHLKYALGLVNIHGKSDSSVLQEIYAQLTAFNFAAGLAVMLRFLQKIPYMRTR